MGPTKQFYYIIGAIVTLCLLQKAYRRLQLSRAKHRSLAGHSRWARRFAALVPYYEYDEKQFFATDDAPADTVRLRCEGFARLTDLYAQRFSETATLTKEVGDSISDMQFTSRYRVPYQFSRYVRERFAWRIILAVITRCNGHRS